MKMVKSFLLGSAAGLVAVAGAQAADLPVKAKPVQYVKICSLYGDGFYYIPGSETCLRFGGYVRADYGYNVNVNAPHYSGDAGAQDRVATRSPYTTRHRLNLNADTRTQTEYGTLRTYWSLHVENRFTTDAQDINQVEPVVQRAFIQWAGFTFGHIVSFAEVPGQLGNFGLRSLHQLQTESTTGANGINSVGYTWALGSGVNLHVAADERRVRSIWNATAPGVRIGGNPATSRTGQWEPSPLVAVRIDQAWGRAGAAFIAQNNRATYYTGGPGCPAGAQVGTTECSNPKDSWGWGARAGVELRLPMIGPGDRFFLSGYYSEGAVRFAGQNLSSPSLFGRGRTVALGFVSDEVFLNGTAAPGQFDSTTAWSVNAGYDHYWTPTFSNGVYGGYIDVSYNDTVINNRSFCSAAQVQTVTAAGVADLTRRCDPGFALFHVGLVTNWYPAPGFRLAVDVLYTGVETAMAGFVSLGQARGLRPTGIYTARDRGITSVMFRAQRGFGGAAGQ